VLAVTYKDGRLRTPARAAQRSKIIKDNRLGQRTGEGHCRQAHFFDYFFDHRILGLVAKLDSVAVTAMQPNADL
jgi:hypothetical protein